MNQTTFKLRFDKKYFDKNDIIEGVSLLGKVIYTPKTKWYHKLFEVLSFGLYKASYYYTIQILENNEIQENEQK